MAYEPNTWAKGDIVTSAKLNHIEQGISCAGGSNELVATFTSSSASQFTSDKTLSEIIDAFEGGANVRAIAGTLSSGGLLNLRLARLTAEVAVFVTEYPADKNSGAPALLFAFELRETGGENYTKQLTAS